MRLLIESKADLNAQNKMGFSALMYASASDNWLALEALLQAGARWDLASKQGLTALQIAQERNFAQAKGALASWIEAQELEGCARAGSQSEAKNV